MSSSSPTSDDISSVIGRKIISPEEQQTLLNAPIEKVESIKKDIPWATKVHAGMDYGCGCLVYFFGTMMLHAKQSNPATMMSMFTAGTYFFVNGQLTMNLGREKDMFWNDTMASWVWMFVSLRQFRLHARIKWAGFSSWAGLIAATYFTTNFTLLQLM
eukprot:PhM_4_TR3712/c0_g2_i1/m.12257